MLNVYSQTTLDLKVFEKINEYRVENGLNELKWDDATYKSTRVHTEYMIKNSELCHTENSETPTFTSNSSLNLPCTLIRDLAFAYMACYTLTLTYALPTK